jgi:CheY-like chemotaxis protein/predicted regulator of Ras-like GTPase activity (Roadblock/LC7/MglB family)
MKTILIVDDETRLLQSIEAGLLLYRNRFRVITATNGKEAVHVLNTTAVDLVITDLKMPEMDGFELLAYIHRRFPFLPAIVMTAFNTPEIEEQLVSGNNLRILEKPIDFDDLADAISKTLEQEGKEGSLTGISLANFLQLLEMEQKTCLLEVSTKDDQGFIYFHQGQLYAAIAGTEKGEEAIYKMLMMEDVHITFKKQPLKKVKRLITKPLLTMLFEGAKRKDELRGGKDRPPPKKTPQESSDQASQEERTGDTVEDFSWAKNNPEQGENDMAQIDDVLGKLKDVEGFMAVGIFTPGGEMAAHINISGIKLDEVGALANDVLLKAQKATGLMDVGRGQTVHVDAPKAHVIAMCLNENADFSKTEAGKAHVHIVLILSKDGNLAMAKIRLGAIIQEVATSFR